MRIVEIGDCSMVIMKDSEDPPWVSVGDIYRKAERMGKQIIVDVNQVTIHYLKSSEFLYAGGRLILYFKEKIPPRFHLHDKVVLEIAGNLLDYILRMPKKSNFPYNNYKQKH